MAEPIRVPHRALAPLLLGAGLAALAVGGMGAAQFRHQFAKAPLLIEPHGLAVDDAGRVYAGVLGARIHVYGPDGELVHAWSVEGARGPLRLRLVPPDRLEVASERSDRVQVYRRDGTPVETRRDPGAWQALGAGHDRRFATARGELYAFEPLSVVRTGPDGRTLVVVEPPRWPLRAVGGRPLPLVLLLFFGAVAVLASAFLHARRARLLRARAQQARRA